MVDRGPNIHNDEMLECIAGKHFGLGDVTDFEVRLTRHTGTVACCGVIMLSYCVVGIKS